MDIRIIYDGMETASAFSLQKYKMCGKPTFWAQANFWENPIKDLYIFFKINIWIKQLLNLLAMKFHTKSFFF